MRFKLRNPLPFVFFALAAMAMAGCQAPAMVQAGVVGGEVGIMYLTRDKELPPPDLEHQIPQHEDWCYQTMGYAECYTKPQDTEADRLINVDPQNRYPLTRAQYYQDVAAANTTVITTTTTTEPPITVVPVPPPVVPAVSVPATTDTKAVPAKPAAKKKPKHHVKKKKKPATTTATPPQPVPNPATPAPAPDAPTPLTP